MVDHETGAHPAEHPERHQPDGTQVRPLAVFAVVFVVVLLSIQLGLYLLFLAFDRSEAAREPPAPPAEVKKAEPAPPEPQLQGIPGFHRNTPAEDLREMNELEDRRLGYGPAEEDGYARIPLRRAQDLILERGLPKGKPGGGKR